AAQGDAARAAKFTRYLTQLLNRGVTANLTRATLKGPEDPQLAQLEHVHEHMDRLISSMDAGQTQSLGPALMDYYQLRATLSFDAEKNEKFPKGKAKGFKGFKGKWPPGKGDFDFFKALKMKPPFDKPGSPKQPRHDKDKKKKDLGEKRAPVRVGSIL